jgi:hypothetical protein
MLRPKWFVPVFLAFELLLSLLQLLDGFHVWYFPLINRWVHYLRFDLGFSLVFALLPGAFIILVYLLRDRKYTEIFLASSISLGLNVVFGFEVAAAVFSLTQVVSALVHFVDVREFLFWLVALFTGFEAMALVHWVVLPFGVESPVVWFAELELSLFYVFAPLSPLIVICCFFVIFIKFLKSGVDLSVQFSNSHHNSNARALDLWRPLKVWSRSKIVAVEDWRLALNPKLILALALLVSLIGPLYPYFPAINPQGIPVGVDFPHYVEWAEEYGQMDLISRVLDPRSLVMFLILIIQKLSNFEISTVVKFLPVLLNFLLTLSIYKMVHNGTEDEEWASFAALLSTLGFTTTVNLYSYFLANMLGLILTFTAIGLLMRAIRVNNTRIVLISSILSSLVLFIHPWTFTQFYFSLLIFYLFYYLIKNSTNESYSMSVYLLFTGISALIKRFLGGFPIGQSIISTKPSITNLFEFWNNNIHVFRILYGGTLSNTIYLSCILIGIYIINPDNIFHTLMLLIVIITFPYYIIVNPDFQSRILFNLPFCIFGAFTIMKMTHSDKLLKREKTIIICFILIYMTVYSLRSLSNFLWG